jgi:Putative adhesin
MSTVTSTGSRPPAQLRVTPRRAVTLAIGVPVLLALVGAIGFSVVALAAQATFPVRATLPLTGGQVAAQINSGNITLRQSGATAAHAELTGTAQYSLERATFTVSGSTVNYDCPLHVGNCNLNATLQVPAHTPVSLSTFGGDVTVPGFTGRLSLNTDGGGVHAGDLAGDVDLSTVGGDVTASGLAGSLHATTDGGNLNIGSMTAPDVVVSSGGGDVSLAYSAHSHAPDLQINSDGGNVKLFLPRGQYQVDVNADGGGVTGEPTDDPSARNVIIVNSRGGDVQFYGD